MLYPRPSDLVSAVEALPAVEEANRWALNSKYRVFFGHTARGGISPYETEYGNEALFQQPQELGDLMGFYRAFGLALKREHHERPDHVSCECEFLMFLALKEAYAIEQNDRDMLVETRKAERLFLRDHLGRFFPSFAMRLSREDPLGFYGKLGELGLHFITAEGANLQVALGAANLGLRPVDDNRVPMACGSGAGCGAMPGASVPEGSESV
jgi:TorA maturation chaperone TorD